MPVGVAGDQIAQAVLVGGGDDEIVAGGIKLLLVVRLLVVRLLVVRLLVV